MSKVRLGILFSLFFLFGAVVIARLFSIQVKHQDIYQSKSQIQEGANEFKRGNIFAQDREGNLFLVATTKSFLRLYAIPSKIPLGKEGELAVLLQKRLGIPAQVLLQRFSKKSDPYEPLKERILLEEKEAWNEVLTLFPEGLKIEEYKDRFYPYNSLASHTIGFVGFGGYEKVGLYGIEKFYERELLRQGADLVLTLDIGLQQYIENVLEGLLQKWKSPSGSIVVMRPKDGAIIAMASKPDFNPNQYQEVLDISVFLNPAVQKLFEPGSIVKPITIAAGLETGKITPETSYIDKGFVKKGGYIIKNAGERVFGKRTMLEVLELSINTGAVFIQEKVGAKDFLRTFENFGFGEKTGIDLPGELGGDITNLDSGRAVNFATASFGQGISATPLQIARALSAIANGGNLMKPYLVQKIIYPNGNIMETRPQVKQRAISQDTAAKLASMMVEVVQKGYSKKAQVPGYLIAGKTGTAQIPAPQGGYLDETIHSFGGFAPAFDPAFLILMTLDKPIGIKFASESIAPTFSSLASYLLRYYEILPDKAIE